MGFIKNKNKDLSKRFIREKLPDRDIQFVELYLDAKSFMELSLEKSSEDCLWFNDKGKPVADKEDSCEIATFEMIDSGRVTLIKREEQSSLIESEHYEGLNREESLCVHNESHNEDCLHEDDYQNCFEQG